MAEYATSIEIAAAPTEVFGYLVSEAGMAAWMGQYASLDARVGGVFAVDIAGYPIRGRYLEVDAPHRVVVSWGVAGSAELPPGTSTVTFTLTPISTGTRVDLVHAGLPDPEVPGHVDGWTHFLLRLRIAATGGVAGHDDWVPIDDRGAHTSSTKRDTR
jgi:uncharacterized protein YndB with AHSA1/START domain